ncbi:MAG TPA: SUMF1/EgtB/PvdO family nonheme iron enzyme [Pyrinomonadaceae bacterium]|jgi:formylglycine-generating enzyme required for sulfatase activity
MKTRAPLITLTLLAAAAACALAPPPARTSPPRQGAGRGLAVVSIRGEDGREVRLYERSYALVIGVSEYTRGWPKLPGVRRDVEEVARALERHGFLVTKVENPDSAQLEKSFKEFIEAYGLGVENRLLFYFAGHGHTIRQSYGEEMGYIVPADAPLPARDPAGFMSRAMDMQQMELYARRVQSKHALFVFDSCFSGALFALSRAVPDAISYKTARPVRQFITSGSADEQVPDQSIFRRQFVEALGGEADLNGDGYITGAELGEHLQDKVINYSRNAQHPQYGKLRNPNLDKGDFVFALPRAAQPPQPPPAAAAAPAPTPAPARPDPAALELAFWDAIKNSADPEDFREYVRKYPAGQFAGIAQRKVAALTAPAPSRPAAGAAPSGAAGRPPASPKARSVVKTRSGIELVYVPRGSFMMGSWGGGADEKPLRDVTFREGFYVGKYEVTQAQWESLMGTTIRQQRDKANPAWETAGEGDDHPVYYVSWDEAQEFIRRLNAQDDGFAYRLPSEAEWEYACRAGSAGPYASERLPLDALGWWEDNSGRQAHPVGRKSPNAFGLYDLHGNVWEWCEDYYHDSYVGAPSDGSAWLGDGASGRRVMRGGSWDYESTHLRSANRDSLPPQTRGNHVGFRVVAVARR